MGQVPEVAGSPARHLLIGSGKLSSHFEKYFSDLGLEFSLWRTPREFPAEFFSTFRSTHVWILVSDRAIASVADRLRSGFSEFDRADSAPPILLHASGATVVPGVVGAHPLMTFGDSLYDVETYRRIPFVVENAFDGRSASDLLGGLPNVAVYLDPSRRPLYHALVSASGNFPALLWADVFSRFERDLGLSRELLAPFLFRTLLNSLEFGESAITGPLVRGDSETVRLHRSALSGTELAPLYSAFESFFRDRFSRRGGEPHVEA